MVASGACCGTSALLQPESRARARARVQVAQGMAAMEAVEPPIAHRDLKPSNVFLDAAGAARVADMNLSLRLHESSLASLTGETGTYLYMSPEMMRHEVRGACQRMKPGTCDTRFVSSRSAQ
jgi:serine/threonine protein kinase